MSKTSKILLALAGLGIAGGLVLSSNLVNVAHAPVLYLVLPLGAIFFGLFLIHRMLEKETAHYDEEQKNHPAASIQTCCEAEPPPKTKLARAH